MTTENAVTAGELTRMMPTADLIDFTLVTTMDHLVRHIWWSGSERTDWDGVGLDSESPYGWAIADIRIDRRRDPVRVTIHFMKVSE